MPEYRFYTLIPVGETIKPPTLIDLPDDASALAIAKKRLDEAILKFGKARDGCAILIPRTDKAATVGGLFQFKSNVRCPLL